MTASRFLRPALAACLLSAVVPMEDSAAAATQAASPAPFTLDSLFAPGGVGRTIEQATWSPDGRHLSYLWKDEQGEALWWLDAVTGQSEVLFRPADWQGRFQGHDSFQLDGHSWSPKGDALLLSAAGNLYLLSLARREVTRLTDFAAAAGAVEDAHFSPQGDRVGFVRAADLYILDLASKQLRPVTAEGRKDVTLNGVNDWVYWEEIWGRSPNAWWWRPDGKAIAYLQFDETPVASYPIVDYAPKYPTVRYQKYPKAGEPNPRVRVGIVEIPANAEIPAAGAATVPATRWLTTGGEDGGYLVRVAWTPDGRELRVQRLNREQTRLDLLRCATAAAAAPACTVLASQEHPTWVNVASDFRPLADGRFLWSSERSGWRRLYLHAADGRELRALTPEGWALASLDAVTADGWAVVTGFSTGRLGAVDRQVYRVRLTDGQVEKLAAEPGTSSALVAEKTGAFVLTWSDADHPNVNTLRRADGSLVAALQQAPPPYDTASLPRWEFLTVEGPGGTALPARLLKPAHFDPQRRYPVIVYHYGGPGSQVVANRWDGRGRDAWHKWMALSGYGIFMLDNSSSIFFGQAGEDRDHRRMGNGNLEAQLAGVAYLKKLPWVDHEHLGLWGWSGGGANTLYCMFNAPGVWKAGVAGAPVTDWTLYDSIWTERYLDRPQDNSEGYRLSSPLTFAENLRDHLLIVHGTADDNVHPQNTLVLTDRLIKARIPFEEALYPRQKHGFKEDANRHFYERMTEFFDRHLTVVAVEDLRVEVRERKPQ